MNPFYQWALLVCAKIKWRVTRQVHLGKGARLYQKVTFEGHNKVHAGAVLANCHIGLGTYVGQYSRLSNAKIGRFCSIGQQVFLVRGTHPSSDWLSSHPAFFSASAGAAGFTFADRQCFNEYQLLPDGRSLEIGHDVWIGSHTLLREGIKIGDGAIIAMGSVVTKDVGAYEVVGGVPAKLIRHRFPHETIEVVRRLPLWKQEFDWYAKNWKSFSSWEMLQTIKFE